MCPCRLSRPSLAPKPAQPIVEILPQDQRRADLAEMCEKLTRMGHGEAAPYLYAAWDAGFTAEQRNHWRIF